MAYGISLRCASGKSAIQTVRGKVGYVRQSPRGTAENFVLTSAARLLRPQINSLAAWTFKEKSRSRAGMEHGDD